MPNCRAWASPSTTSDEPPDVVGVLFFAYAMFAAVDWLYSLIPVRFPEIRICLSEGGIGWVPGLLDRLDHMRSYQMALAAGVKIAMGTDMMPADRYDGTLAVYTRAPRIWRDDDVVLLRHLAEAAATELEVSALSREPMPAEKALAITCVAKCHPEPRRRRRTPRLHP